MSTPFVHQHAAHCESGVAANLLRHHGMALSEPMVFGLSSALSFAYLPFIKISGMPLIAYRIPPKQIIKRLGAILGTPFRFETFRTPKQGQTRLDELLAQNHVVGLQTSVYWLPYFPQDMRFHFNAHNLVVFGKQDGLYQISDPVFETSMQCAPEDLNRARFTKGMLAPKGRLYTLAPITENNPQSKQPFSVSTQTMRKAIRKTCRHMLSPAPIAGIKGIKLLAKKIYSLNPTDASSLQLVGHIVRMQEEIGTGGAGFRFLYAAFLQEASTHSGLHFLHTFADELMGIGDDWRMFALTVARMIRGRAPFEPQLLSRQLTDLATKEASFFTQLKQQIEMQQVHVQVRHAAD